MNGEMTENHFEEYKTIEINGNEQSNNSETQKQNFRRKRY